MFLPMLLMHWDCVRFDAGAKTLSGIVHFYMSSILLIQFSCIFYFYSFFFFGFLVGIREEETDTEYIIFFYFYTNFLGLVVLLFFFFRRWNKTWIEWWWKNYILRQHWKKNHFLNQGFFYSSLANGKMTCSKAIKIRQLF